MKDQEALINKIQRTLRGSDIPGWLFYDFRLSDPIAYQTLHLDPNTHPTRRWFYFIPAEGQPHKLVHRIESTKLDSLPGVKSEYLRWQELESSLARMLKGYSRVAMQYSKGNAIPYVSYVDAGTVEMIRGCGIEVVSSADVIQRLDAVCDPLQLDQHRQAARAITTIVQQAFEETANRIRLAGRTTEFEIQQFILNQFEEEGLVTDFPPIVGVNQNSADPHYCPLESQSSDIQSGDFLLIDLWARVPGDLSIFADITWTAIFDAKPPEEIDQVFQIVRQARNRGVEFLQESFSKGAAVQGYEVDNAVREVIRTAGLSEHFAHRTGHSLGREVHGSGVNFDNLETQDTRQVIPGLLCTIEPGVYLSDFGVRSEINIYIAEDGPEITTPPQDSILAIPVS
jgi:Xaa-Pro aminopeptidase